MRPTLFGHPQEWAESLSDLPFGDVMFMNMIANDHELLGQFVREQSQDAFTALVRRHLNLVYSAALRQVRSPQLAEEVCQSVFANLARSAAGLKPDTILTAWLYQVTRHTAIDVVRSEARRQAREQIAVQMSENHDTSTEWADIEPLLDEAMQSLDEADRAALLLRYFENKSLREVGESLGASEDAAQKRVSRAVDHLREFFLRRKVAVGVSGLAALLSANAVQAAPAGLAATVLAGAGVASSAIGVSTVSACTAATLTQTITMTAIQKTIIITMAAGAIAIGAYQAREVSRLRSQVQTLEKREEQQAGLSNQLVELRRERDRATNALAALAQQEAVAKQAPNEMLKLRGEVGRLRQENYQIGSTSAVSKITANPEARKLMRDQQKLGMSSIYLGLAERLNLTPEQTDKFYDLLADHIMSDVDNITTVLRDKPSAEEMDQMFARQEAVLHSQVEELLGPDGLRQYHEYTKSLLSELTSRQFKGLLTGSDEEKTRKAGQFREVLEAETQAALEAAGLPPDYQAIPMLNFRNIASEKAGEESLKMLEAIYTRAAERSGAFLSPDELTNFAAFKTTALSASRSALAMNRTLMAPISQ